MSGLGKVLLAAVFLLCSFATVFGLAASTLKIETAKKVFLWSRRAMLVAMGLAVLVLLLAFAAFLMDDFSIAVVRQYSSVGLPSLYKISAVWAGSAGSLLLWWVVILVLFGMWQIANRKSQMANGKLQIANGESQMANGDGQNAISELRFDAIALSIGAGICLAFSALLIFVAKPFASCPLTDDGAGLNPLLQNFWMIVHPPLLFVGYSVFLIPFVIVLAGVFARRMEGPALYVRLRRWLLAGICFLSLGIAAGARWSYVEPGWGGYWTWDPVENASLLPWFVAVAALHSLVGIDVAGRFRRWAAVLAPLPFISCLVATFITRSGVLNSLHSFDQSVMFSSLLAFIGCCFLLWMACVIRAVKHISIGSSRPGVFFLDKSEILVLANLVFVLTAVIIGTATFWPVISPVILPVIRRVITAPDSSFTLTPVFYGWVILVVGILLTFLVGLAALTDWQKHRSFITLVLGCCGVGLVCFSLIFKSGEKQLIPGLVCGVCAFSFIALLAKLWLNLKTRSGISAGIAHLGLVLLVVTAVFSSSERVVRTRLTKGEKIVIGQYEFIYDSFVRESFGGIVKAGPEVIVRKVKGKGLVERIWPSRSSSRGRRTAEVAVLWPHNNLYANGQSTTEVGVRTGLFEDVYVLLDDVDQDGRVLITAKVKPLMLWLWFSGVLIVGGLVLALFEGKRGAKQKEENVQTVF